MLKLNIWASPLCFAYAPQAQCSLWSHLLRCYHLIHQPPLTSGQGSHITSNVLGRAGKSRDFRARLLVMLCLLPASTSQTALQLPLVQRVRGPQLHRRFDPFPGQQCGNTFGATLNQSFHVLEKMSGLHVPRRVGGLAQPWTSGTGSYMLPVPCPQGVNPSVEVCVLGVCRPRS